jgi:plastocyanin domain-containing protein
MADVNARLTALIIATLVVAGLLWAASSALRPKQKPPSPPVQALPGNLVEVSITEKGFEPAEVHVKSGQPVTLSVTRKTDMNCGGELVVPGILVKLPLPFGVPIRVTFQPPSHGPVRYGCGEPMTASGVLVVD